MTYPKSAPVRANEGIFSPGHALANFSTRGQKQSQEQTNVPDDLLPDSFVNAIRKRFPEYVPDNPNVALIVRAQMAEDWERKATFWKRVAVGSGVGWAIVVGTFLLWRVVWAKF